MQIRRGFFMRIAYHARMSISQALRKPRPAGISKAASRTAILEAARRVAARDGARNLSLRGVAGAAGFAPAALYGYFRNKDELLLALAAEDLSAVARAMRVAAKDAGGTGRLSAASSMALSLFTTMETIAA